MAEKSIPILSVGADVDVKALVQEIQAEVARKAAAGVYPPDLLTELEASTDTLGTSLVALRDSAVLQVDPPVTSPRRTVGRAVTTVKRGMRIGLRWYSRWMVGQTSTFASNVVATTSAVVERLHEHEAAIGRLEAGLAQEKADVRQKLALTAAQPDQLEARSRPGDGEVSASGRSAQVERNLDYLEFENRYRGSREEIAKRQSAYLDLYRGVPGPVLDAGCGRGEFLEVLREAGLPGYGVDMSEDMVATCREKGLEARREDLLEHLAGLEPASLGGIFSAQVIEHLDPAGVIRFFELAALALGEGGMLVVETLNPQSLATFTNALYVDLGHLRPLHPLTLTFLAEGAGFKAIEVRYSSPLPAEDRLRQLPESSEPALGPVVDLLNQNLRRIDETLYGPQDFAVIARR